MADESIGKVSVDIVGDYSGLEKSFNDAQGLAQKAGQQIGDSLAAGAAGADKLTASAELTDEGIQALFADGMKAAEAWTRFGVTADQAAAGLGAKEEDTVGRKKTEAESIEAITVCLEGGVDINAADGRGQTALYGAALQGYDEVVKFLLAHGAKPGIKDQRGFTALDAAEGKAGGFGFGGGAANPHPTTAKILRDAM